MTNTPLLTDTHCHLVSEKLWDQAPELVKKARKFNVHRIINIGYDADTVRRGFELAKQHSQVWSTIGIQPHDASSFSYELCEKLFDQFTNDESFAAVGEIGLDAHYTLSPMTIQMDCFDAFLQKAVELRKPVVVHVRETHRKVHQMLSKYKSAGITGVIHCFTGTLEEAREFLDLGFFLSFSGIVTFKNSEALREVAKKVPLERLLIETDSPYLAPVPHRGKPNQPAYLVEIAKLIADVREIALERLCEATEANTDALFRLQKGK